MISDRIGGNESDVRYLGLYVVGVIFGSLIRVIAFVFPSQIVDKIENLLVGDLK